MSVCICFPFFIFGLRMEITTVNLTRKWRSQNFDQIIGQDLAIRILKNSLYLGHYFPVYLFAGQRGCGKTSTARIFAAAINCEKLSQFQKNPKMHSIPCLTCTSCQAMQNGNHPDFIEIDAASHTGVDNMRNIIESSSLMPIMGTKRVYLIDEAHMLSKAAFNAALKILEEPPATALFILATTNPHKILDTVRSRCFQLFFTPIAHDPLKNHLKAICAQEKIVCEDAALDIIIRHTDGSARDALNMLEQVRFSSAAVTPATVLKLLGHMSDQQILDIVITTLQGSAPQLLDMLRTLSLDQYSAEFIWQRVMIILRALLWAKYGIHTANLVSCAASVEQVASHLSLEHVHHMIEVLYSYEELFTKTTMQHVLLEMILLNLCRGKKKTDGGAAGSAPCAALSVTDIVDVSDVQEQSDEQEDDVVDTGDGVLQWKAFVEQMIVLNHPIISSLFKQSQLIAYDATTKKVRVEYPKELLLFQEWIEATRHIWQPHFDRLFGQNHVLEGLFTGNKTPVHREPVQREQQPVKNTSGNSAQGQFVAAQGYNKKKQFTPVIKREESVNVSDANTWRVASMLLRHFPGTITEIGDAR